MNAELVEPMVVAIRWLLIGLWTLVIALLPRTDDDWWILFAVVGGAIIVVALCVLVIFSIGSLG